MDNRKNTNEVMEECLKKILGLVNASWLELAMKYGYKSSKSLSETFRRWRKKNPDYKLKDLTEAGCEKYDFDDIKEKMPKCDIPNTDNVTIELNKDGTQTSERFVEMTQEQAKDKVFLLRAHGFDPYEWELTAARNNMWNTYSKKDGVQVLYSSKIVCKPRTDTICVEELVKEFFEIDRLYEPPKLHTNKYLTFNKMLEIPIMDLHLSKMGWAPEVGENYDHKIAEERFLYVISDFINRTKHYNFEKIIFPLGQDILNFDDIKGDTTKGTRQNNDLRWQKVYIKGTEIIIKAIDMLHNELQAPIEVFYVPGNHDKATSYYLTTFTYAWYRNTPTVNVNIDPTVRKYIEYGSSLIGFSHGSEERNNIYKLMQVEARESWGRTMFHEWHLGHLHSEQTREEGGLICRKISSITGTDSWHHESGFVGAIKKAQAFVWDKEIGLTDILNSVIICKE